MKGSRVEYIEEARKEYKKLLEEGWGKTFIFESYFKVALSLKFVFIYNEVNIIMQISFFSKIVLFLTFYCISDMSIKNNIFRKIANRAFRAKKC